MQFSVVGTTFYNSTYSAQGSNFSVSSPTQKHSYFYVKTNVDYGIESYISSEF